MIIGHYAVAFAGKKWAPKASLGTLLMAAIWLDLLWPVFVLLGLENFTINPNVDFNNKFLAFNFTDYPLSHSLVMALAWAAGFALVYYILAKDKAGSWVVGALVLSHWLLDAVVHVKDLPILPAETGYMVHKVGMGLWASTPGTIFVEAALFTGGVILYYFVTQSKDTLGEVAFWGLVAFMVGSYVLDVTGPVPGDTKMVASVAQLQWLVVIWGYWIEGHRKKV